MISIIPIITPSIDINITANALAQALGGSHTRAIDHSVKELTNDAKMVILLSEFLRYQPHNVSARQQMQEAESELFFLYYGLLCYTDKETADKVRERTRLSILSEMAINANYVFFLGGTLDLWRAATIECCSDRSTHNLRLLFDKILLYFESRGLVDLWANYRKVPQKDQTFLIEEKK